MSSSSEAAVFADLLNIADAAADDDDDVMSQRHFPPQQVRRDVSQSDELRVSASGRGGRRNSDGQAERAARGRDAESRDNSRDADKPRRRQSQSALPCVQLP